MSGQVDSDRSSSQPDLMAALEESLPRVGVGDSAEVAREISRLRVENAMLKDSANRAAEMLSMTRCPYYQREEKCDRGCWSEPACHTDQPTEGWVEGAFNALMEVLALDDDAAPASDESQETT